MWRMAPPETSPIHALQNRLSELVGCVTEDRQRTVANMLQRSPSEATGYWLQLFVAVGIATLGLVLGSNAVVIGAMLIAPLMTPIVSFGMGLAVGSPFLVLRSGVRIALSVGFVLASSSALTRLLPFHEMNPEIAARTTPTVLDLLVAAFCALAGVYAAVRPASNVASTAAGTSIGISLVPPLCVSGYGFGTGVWSVAGGAGLLFFTNLVAIVFVGTVSFAAMGFQQVAIRALEAEELARNDDAPLSRWVALRLERVFASRSGPWLRWLMPCMLLALVYVPLRRGLDEVAWQIRVRKAVDLSIGQLSSPVIDSRVRVERREVDLALVVLGTTLDAEAARRRLRTELQVTTGVEPRLQVFAVPDATALAGLETALARPEPPIVVQPPPSAQLDVAAERVRAALDRRWPHQSAGKVAALSITRANEATALAIVHLGPALGAAALEALERALREDLGAPVELVDRALPAEPLPLDGDALELVARLAPLLERSRQAPDVWACLVQPRNASTPAERAAPRSAGAVEAAPPAAVGPLLRRLVAEHPRAKVTSGAAPSLEFRANGCPEPPAPPLDPAPAALPTEPAPT